MTGALARSVAALTFALSRPDAAGHLNVTYGPRVGPVELGHRMFCNFRDCKPLQALRRRCRGWKISQVLDQGVAGSPAWWLGVDREPRQALTATRRVTRGPRHLLDRHYWRLREAARGGHGIHAPIAAPEAPKFDNAPARKLLELSETILQFCSIVESRRYSRRKICHAISVPLPPVTMPEVRRR